jgi:hypothetical protein
MLNLCYKAQHNTIIHTHIASNRGVFDVNRITVIICGG